MRYFKKFPSYKQLLQTDCAPACLRIVAKYHGKYFELQDLKDKCGTTKSGTSILNICKGGEMIGLRTFPTKITFNNLKTKGLLPVIIHWEDNHFIVVYRISKKHVYVSDPSKGLIKYNLDQFANGWLNGKEEGIAIFIEPTSQFDDQDVNKSNSVGAMSFIISYLAPYKKSIYLLMFLSLLLAFVGLFLPLLTKSIIDIGITARDMDFIEIILIANIALVVFRSLSEWARSSLTMHIASRIKISMASDYLYKLLNLPISFFETRLLGDILQRSKDQERIQDFIMGSALSVFLSSIMLLVFGALLFSFNTTLFYIFLIANVLYIAWMMLFFGVVKRMDVRYFQLVGKTNSQWFEILKNIDDIKANNYERYKRWQWEEIQAKLYVAGVKMLNINNAKQFGADLINSLKDVALVFVATKSVIDGEMTLGMMISIQFIIAQMVVPVNDIIKFISSIQLAYISYLRVNEVNTTASEDKGGADRSFFPNRYNIIFRNVFFKYNPHGDWILSGLTFKVDSGKMLAIVGESGSGKSTVLKLILHFYDPLNGEVMLGNINLNNIHSLTLREKIGYAAFDSSIYNDTISKNIILDAEYDHEKMTKVLQAVNFEKEVSLMQLGLRTKVGENGKGLSAGQKQRIIIARALYKDPELLLLDEATGALDMENEQHVMSQIQKEYSNKTRIIATHRLSSVKNADQIVVLKRGSIVEVGTHDSLIERKGLYFDMYAKQ